MVPRGKGRIRVRSMTASRERSSTLVKASAPAAARAMAIMATPTQSQGNTPEVCQASTLPAKPSKTKISQTRGLEKFQYVRTLVRKIGGDQW